MNTSSINSLLQDLGLTENEARVYVAMLSLGPTTALELSKQSQVKRTTVYLALESLKEKGLVRIEIKGLKRVFVAESPERLELMLDIKKQTLTQSLPDLLSMYNTQGEQGRVKQYEGKEQIKHVYDSLLTSIRPKEDYLVFGDSTKWHDLDPKFFSKFIERRSKLSINIRIILQDSEIARHYKKFEKNHNQEIKLLPSSVELSTNVVVLPRKVVIHNLLPPMSAIVVENSSVVKTHKEMFEIMWSSL
ncbi:MAG: TrmB family transcriptional regulator [Patescibacteria group bacterium]